MNKVLLDDIIHLYMIKSCTCICKGRQDKVRHSPKADSEKNIELPRTGFEPVTTGLHVQLYMYMYMYLEDLSLHQLALQALQQLLKWFELCRLHSILCWGTLDGGHHPSSERK